LTVVSERIPGIRSVSLGIWIKAGSNTDPLEKMGIAHFTEHMLFKGTRKRSAYDIADAVESVGGTLDAFTSRNLTCYHAHVPGEYADLVLDILSDIMIHSVFAPEEIERERNVIIEEISSAQDVPEEAVQDAFTDIVLNPLPESKPILGTHLSVREIRRDDFLEFTASHYTGPNTIIAAAGNVEHVNIVRAAEECFRLAATGGSRPIENAERESSTLTCHIAKNISQAHICVGSRIFGYPDSRRMSLCLLNTILGNGMSSRLFQNIREKHGLTYSIYSFTELFETVGVIATYLATDVKNIDRVLELVKYEYSRLYEEKIGGERLERAKSQYKGNFILHLENVVNRMNRLARNEIFFGKHRDISDTMKRIDSVSEKDIQETARDIFRENVLRTVIVSP